MKIDQARYKENFRGKEDKALQFALDTRKFEIELYWKRATYFWTFIGATLAGYLVIQTAKDFPDKQYFSVILGCLGFLFSFAWHCVNRGSKQWQENWENHVDLLEDSVIGPLYKTVLRRREAKNVKEYIVNVVTGPFPISVSGINQIISIYVVALWLFVIKKSIGIIDPGLPVRWEFAIPVLATMIACLAFVSVGRTFKGTHGHEATQRESQIV
jgi:hypothetical protein